MTFEFQSVVLCLLNGVWYSERQVLIHSENESVHVSW